MLYHCTRTPFRLVTESLNLSDRGEAKAFLGFVEAEHKRAPLRLIVIDTLSQTSTGADENSNSEMAVYFKHVQAMVNRTGATVRTIHHSGKDVSKGERGAFAIRGNVDTSIEVRRMKNRADGDPIDVVQLGMKKQKDDGAGRIGEFEMYSVPLGLDQEGQPYDSLVLRPHGIAATDGAEKDFLDPSTALLNWIARAVGEAGGRMSFKELIQARMPFEKTKEGTVRKNIKAAIREGRDAARIASDGTAIWMERAGNNPNGDLDVIAEGVAS
ncbi:AAA family ATPase [Pseudoxanthomonas mexicana]